MPDGVFEGDIILSKEQAIDIFSPYIETESKTLTVRKVTEKKNTLWRTFPINYMFDGSHSKLLLNLKTI